jgi:hypothetical protein
MSARKWAKINGRYHFMIPFETRPQPSLQLLGTHGCGQAPSIVGLTSRHAN